MPAIPPRYRPAQTRQVRSQTRQMGYRYRTVLQTDRLGRQTDRYRQTDIDRQQQVHVIFRQISISCQYRQIDRYRQTDIDRQTGRQTDRQILDGTEYRQIDQILDSDQIDIDRQTYRQFVLFHVLGSVVQIDTFIDRLDTRCRQIGRDTTDRQIQIDRQTDRQDMTSIDFRSDRYRQTDHRQTRSDRRQIDRSQIDSISDSFSEQIDRQCRITDSNSPQIQPRQIQTDRQIGRQTA